MTHRLGSLIASLLRAQDSLVFESQRDAIRAKAKGCICC